MDDRRIPHPDGDVGDQTVRPRESIVFVSASEQLLERAKNIAEGVQDRVRRVMEASNPNEAGEGNATSSQVPGN